MANSRFHHARGAIPSHLEATHTRGMRTYLLTIAITLSLSSSAACVDESPRAWLETCESLEPYPRADACKESCGGVQLCPGADQQLCELECRTCEPSVAWCPEAVAQ